MDDIRRHMMDKIMKARDHKEFAKKGIDAMREKQQRLSYGVPERAQRVERQFPIVAQTYFGVARECLEGMVGQKILQKSSSGGRI